MQIAGLVRGAALVALAAGIAVSFFYEGNDAGWRAGWDAGWRRGFSRSVEFHGDWLITRLDGRCAAVDPNARKIEGLWPISDDGRCHLSNLLRDIE
jgi:hypothetical protein